MLAYSLSIGNSSHNKNIHKEQNSICAYMNACICTCVCVCVCMMGVGVYALLCTLPNEENPERQNIYYFFLSFLKY